MLLITYYNYHSLIDQIFLENGGSSYNRSYKIPGGAVEQGETLEEAAIREVKEETGFEVEIDGIFSVSEAFFEDRGHHAIFFTFRGIIIGGEINLSIPEEIEEITWMDSQKAEKYIHIIDNTKGMINSISSVPYILREIIIPKF